MHWMILPLKRYAEFSGRSRRIEYWMFTLFQFLLYMALGSILVLGIGFTEGAGLKGDDADTAMGIGAVIVLGLMGILWLALLVPNLAVIARRMQDQDIPGWVGIVLYLVGLLIGITSFVLFVMSFIGGTRGPNRYGPDPKDPGAGGADIFA